MIVVTDPTAREILHDMSALMGPLYVEAVWSMRAFEQEARNRRASEFYRDVRPARTVRIRRKGMRWPGVVIPFGGPRNA